MAAPLIAAALAALLVGGAQAERGGPWSAGWGFASHGGVPPQPANLQSYQLNRSVVGYFVANNTGLASAEELAAEVKLGIVGIGWNLYHSQTSKTGGIEEYEIQQAKALKAQRPDVGVMVLRNTEVVSTFWSSFRDAMNDTDIWLQSPPGSGKPINEPWGTDDPRSGGPTPKFFLNFSNPKTQTWWLEKYVGPALDQPDIDGVYTDCSCGTARGEHFTQAEAVGRQKAFDAALALAKSKGKWLSAWAGPALVHPPSAPKDNCVDTVKGLIALGANSSLGMQLTGGWARPKPPRPPPGPPGPALQCGGGCTATKGLDTDNSGIVSPPVPMANQKAIDDPASVAQCCSLCKANRKCDVWEIGHGGCVPGTPNCTVHTINCFLIGGFRGRTKPNPDRVVGCVKQQADNDAPVAPAEQASVEDTEEGAALTIEQSTIATFLIARGPSAVITLPPYDHPMLGRTFALEGVDPNADPGTPLGPASLSGSTFTRHYTKAHVTLDCDTLQSTIDFGTAATPSAVAAPAPSPTPVPALPPFTVHTTEAGTEFGLVLPAKADGSGAPPRLAIALASTINETLGPVPMTGCPDLYYFANACPFLVERGW